MADLQPSPGEPWVKTVRGKSILMPTVDLVRQTAKTFTSDGVTDMAAVRKALANRFETYGVCPVTMRRHIKTLGLQPLKKVKV